MEKQLLKRAGSAVLALAVLAGGAAAVLPMTAPESGIEAQAASSERDFYTAENDDGTLTVVGYKGTSGVANIPSSIFGQKVTAISNDDYNGKDWKSATSVVIPSSVTEIKDNAFYECTSLKSVTIPDSVKVLGASIFRGCTSLTTVRLPNKPDLSSYGYGEYMFGNCTSLKSISIPNGWTLIPDFMFRGCTGLTSVTIPNSVKKIGCTWGYSFQGCSSLTSISIPDSVTEIDDTGSALPDCTSLKSVRLSNNLTDIPRYTFDNCNNLKSITIPSSVKSIGESAIGFAWDMNFSRIKNSDLAIYGTKGSAAEQYANKNGFKFVDKSVVPTSVSLNKTSMTLGKNETTKLTATVAPNNATDKTVKWRTSNSKILTVEKNGNVKAINNGTAWITARTVNGKEKSCKITVKNAPAKVAISKGVVTIGVGEKFTVGSAIPDGSAAAKRTYRTSNSSIVKMTRTDWQGDFVGVKEGVAYVTVRTYNGKESTCKVTVKKAPASVGLNKTAMTLKVGQSASLNAVIPNGAGCAARTFRTSNASIVKMTKTNWTGQFKAVKKGVAWVTVRTYNGKEKSCKITVV